ncbi:hypothetical protein T08_15273, partial [Trichinella sp. T8]
MVSPLSNCTSLTSCQLEKAHFRQDTYFPIDKITASVCVDLTYIKARISMYKKQNKKK